MDRTLLRNAFLWLILVVVYGYAVTSWGIHHEEHHSHGHTHNETGESG